MNLSLLKKQVESLQIAKTLYKDTFKTLTLTYKKLVINRLQFKKQNLNKMTLLVFSCKKTSFKFIRKL